MNKTRKCSDCDRIMMPSEIKCPDCGCLLFWFDVVDRMKLKEAMIKLGRVRSERV